MRNAFTILVLTFIVIIEIQSAKGQTYCNPMNLSYGFGLDQPSRREASDPTIVLFKDQYFLFASKAGGYWHSPDLLSWKLVTSSPLPLEREAPTAVAIGDWLYFFTSFTDTIFRSNDPASGKWEVYNSAFPLSMVSDLAVFADTDGRVYSYYGCSNNGGVMIRELDINKQLNPTGVPLNIPLKNNTGIGWRKAKDKSGRMDMAGVEASWMTKYKGKYYYQCTEPDADQKNYCDVIYTSNSPVGPFQYAATNPFSSRPTGFVNGANRGCTFADKYGNWWHVATLSANGKRNVETRLGLFPAYFDENGDLLTYDSFVDYPLRMPQKKLSEPNEYSTGWSLLSFSKTAEASSSLSTNPVAMAFDEDLGTFWSAKTGNENEWLSVDLGSLCTIHALQVNLAEHNTRTLGRNGVQGSQYLVQYSADQKVWKTLVDKTTNTDDLTHFYDALETPVQGRYVKIVNHCMADGTFAVSGLRIFGLGSGEAPSRVNTFYAARDLRDPGTIKLTWTKQSNATGYHIRYGTEKDQLIHSCQVYKNSPVIFRGLDKKKTYWFEVDAFNENGVTPSIAHPSH